jgi:hypothetical protein
VGGVGVIPGINLREEMLWLFFHSTPGWLLPQNIGLLSPSRSLMKQSMQTNHGVYSSVRDGHQALEF